MLKVFRDNLRNLAPVLWVVIAVFVLLMFAYPGDSGSAGSSAAATVNGTDISYASYQQAYRNLEDRFRQIYGESYTPDLAKQIGLPMQAINSLVAQEILLEEAKDLGLAATDEEVRKTILEFPAFQNERGNFDNELYARTLRSNRLTVDGFEKDTRRQLLLQKFNRVLADSVWISDAEAERSAREETESAQIRYVKLTAADITEDLPVSQPELETYFADHRDEFSIEEQRALTYLSINNNVVRASLEISDEDLQAYYDANPDEFTREEQVRARHILLFVSEERTAEQATSELEALKARIEGGETFDDLARQYSEDEETKERGGNLGFFGRNRMTPQFEQAAFAADAGSLVGPVENQLGPRTGYHLIQVENKREGGLQPFEEVKNRIRVRQQTDQARVRTEAVSKEIQSEIGGRIFGSLAELEEYASGNDLIGVESTALVTRDANIPGIGRNAAFNQAAFATTEGILSEPVRIGAGWALVTSFEIQPPRLPELTEVEADVRAALQQEKKDAEANLRLAEASRAAGPDATIDAIAEALGKTVTESPLIRTTGAVAGISSDNSFNRSVLDLNEGDFGGPVETNDGAVLYQVAIRNRFDLESFAAEKESTLERLREQRATAMMQSLIEQRRAEIKLSIDPQLQESFALPTAGTG